MAGIHRASLWFKPRDIDFIGILAVIGKEASGRGFLSGGAAAVVYIMHGAVVNLPGAADCRVQLFFPQEVVPDDDKYRSAGIGALCALCRFISAEIGVISMLPQLAGFMTAMFRLHEQNPQMVYARKLPFGLMCLMCSGWPMSTTASSSI